MKLAELVDGLRDSAAYPHAAADVVVVQTHASVVFLAGEYAYKIKKPVDFGFLDYSTLARRRAMCDAEVALNARLAPEVYLGVVPVTRHAGRPRIGGDGVAVEFAVKMRRLPDQARLGSRLAAGEVGVAFIERLAERLAQFHREARRDDAVAAFAMPDVVARNCEENFTQLEGAIGSAVSERVFRRLVQSTRAELSRQSSRIEGRAQCLACETHGDLRLEHIYAFPERAEPSDLAIVDCIEFNERFRFADPVADVAFIVMDLRAHGYRDLADRIIDRYLAAADDRDGRALLPLYTAYRATVRGKVRAMHAQAAELASSDRAAALQGARGHLLQAIGELAEPDQRPCVLLMCGLPGTGKSVLASGLSQAANFSVVRADTTRKRLAGLSPLTAAGNAPERGIYGPEWTQRTYAACLEAAERLLLDGQRVIIDASFRSEAQRGMFVEAIGRWYVPLRIVHCVTGRDVVHTRLDRRVGDPSDADWGVYQHMETIWDAFGPQTVAVVDVVDTEGPVEVVVARAAAALRRHGLLGEDGAVPRRVA